ncbi:MAG: hypothetical protein IJ371_04270 [Clostridia bacterium]|nr:hypothetical protein [Clostridia bacterium]
MKLKISDYTKFRNESNFKYKQLKEIDGNIYFNEALVQDETQKYAEGDEFLNIGYNFKNSNSRILSNLYPMEFKFRGKKVKSIEGVLQGIKYRDKHTQNLVLKYAGLDAYHTRACNSLDFWGNAGVLYWQGKAIQRKSEEYQIFLDELYLSALKNPLYKRALLASGNKYLLHHIGREDINETVLTRFEYESRLNTLRVFVKKYNL